MLHFHECGGKSNLTEMVPWYSWLCYSPDGDGNVNSMWLLCGRTVVMNLRTGCAVQMITSLYIHHSHTFALFFLSLDHIFLSLSLSLSIYIYILTEREILYIPGTSECLLFGGLLPSNSEGPLSLHSKRPVFIEANLGVAYMRNRVRWSQKFPDPKGGIFFLVQPKIYTVGSIWKNYSDLSRGHPKWWFSKGSVPKPPLIQV